ncbi:ZIP family metal transporter [Ekhidna sp.]|uniref:ZIP family metal transporter n=1 Tax=Ekhidna sp. TaxID=2608089 RepID=UPI003B5B7D1D
MINLLIFSGLAGVTVIAGGILANVFDHHLDESPIKYEISHSLMSFGAGVMLSALALVLIPTSMERLGLGSLIFYFLLGAVLFFYLDRYLGKRGGSTATLLAMMMDFVPESIALGAVFASETNVAYLLAVFIGLQNLPEAFNAFRDLVQSGFSTRRSLIIFFFLSFAGIVGALIGYLVLSDYPETTARLMCFASGGILYLLIQDIIPESKLKTSYVTSLGASVGFLIGMVGEKLI